MTETALWEGRTLREWVPASVDGIVRYCNPRRVILFGSVVRGEEGPDSDLDFMVVLDDLDPSQRMDLMGKIRSATTTKIPIDVFVTGVEEFERRKDVPNSMQYWPAHEGEVVYQRPPDLRAEARRWLGEAREELCAAGVLAEDLEIPMRMPAFWCHLASEKALKGLATARGIALRKAHKLIQILDALPEEDSAAFHVEHLRLLDPWQAHGRYPGDFPGRGSTTAESLVAAAKSVLGTAERLVEAGSGSVCAGESAVSDPSALS